jgi:hypothetical protein
MLYVYIYYIGMRKHALDRKFDKNEDIDLTAKKGSRRSRKKVRTA